MELKTCGYLHSLYYIMSSSVRPWQQCESVRTPATGVGANSLHSEHSSCVKCGIYYNIVYNRS